MIKKTIEHIKRTVSAPEVEGGARPHYDSSKAFDLPHYTGLTKAQIRHLCDLRLDIHNKTVLDVGCGIGHLSGIFDAADCKVCCVDGRADNISRLKELYPHRRAEVVDMEGDSLEQFGKFDIVFCYGLLYHVADVDGVIRKCSAVTDGMFLLETCITPIADNIVRLVWENPHDVTQALRAWGSRPSPLYIETCLQMNGFEYIYAPRVLPDHPQFQYKYVKELSKFPPSALARDIFIASRKPIDNPHLIARGPSAK